MASKERHHDSPVRAVRWKNREVVVDVEGDIDLGRSVAFQQELLKLLDERPKRVVVNLGGVQYMDSSGVASLVKLLSSAKRQGTEVRLAAMSPRVRSIFEITRLETVFDIRETVEEAME